jgi:hypothetical protein
MSDALRNLAASILDHPWLILIFVAIGFVRWLTEKAKDSKDVPQPPEPPPTEPIQRSNPQSEEERIRRFLEALGQPRGAQPPPPVARRSTVRRVVTPAPPPFGSPLPPLKTVPPPLPAAPQPPPMPTQLQQQKSLRSTMESEPRFEIRALGEAEDASRRSSKVARPEPSTLGGRLKTAQSLRDAIVLREIFGPPRSLQPVDLTSGIP